MMTIVIVVVIVFAGIHQEGIPATAIAVQSRKGQSEQD